MHRIRNAQATILAAVLELKRMVVQVHHEYPIAGLKGKIAERKAWGEEHSGGGGGFGKMGASGAKLTDYPVGSLYQGTC